MPGNRQKARSGGRLGSVSIRILMCWMLEGGSVRFTHFVGFIEPSWFPFHLWPAHFSRNF